MFQLLLFKIYRGVFNGVGILGFKMNQELIYLQLLDHEIKIFDFSLAHQPRHPVWKNQFQRENLLPEILG